MSGIASAADTLLLQPPAVRFFSVRSGLLPRFPGLVHARIWARGPAVVGDLRIGIELRYSPTQRKPVLSSLTLQGSL